MATTTTDCTRRAAGAGAAAAGRRDHIAGAGRGGARAGRGEPGDPERLPGHLRRGSAGRGRRGRPPARRRRTSAPLLGVPVAIKDDVDLAGHTTPFGCGGGRPAVRDAEMVRRLREAGAILIGKTHAPEVGLWHFTETPLHGATRNPWNTDHTPGGSSGGAAAAVAAGVVPAAIGSDGAGSIRIPAAWTGLVGLKPQRGRVSTWPDPEAFNGLSCYGPLARSVADAALLLDAVHGNVPADLHRPPPPSEPFAEAAAREPGRLRIAVSFATPFGVPARSTPSTGRRSRPSPSSSASSATRSSASIPTTAWSARRSSPAARRPSRNGSAPTAKTAPRWSRARAPTPASARRCRACPCASPAPPSRPAAPDRPRLRALRRRPHPDHGEAAAAHRRPRGRGLLGDQQHRQRHLPLRLRLERDRLARDQRPRRAHLQRACRSAPSCSAAKTTRRRCSRSPGRLSAPKAAGPP